MRINLENYELYVLDYLEGNLSNDLKAEFDVFLMLNPHLADEIYELNDLKLSVKNEINFDKGLLIKDLFSDDNIEIHFDDLCIDYIENQFSEDEQIKFEKFLKSNPEKQIRFEQFKKCRLDKNFNEIFKNNPVNEKNLILSDADFEDELCIAYIEQDLSKSQSILLEDEFNSNLSLDRNVKLFKHLILKEQTDVIFTDKLSLLKLKKRSISISYRYAIAASLLFFGMLLLPRFTSQLDSNLAFVNCNNTDKLLIIEDIETYDSVKTEDFSSNFITSNILVNNKIYNQIQIKEETYFEKTKDSIQTKTIKSHLALLSLPTSAQVNEIEILKTKTNLSTNQQLVTENSEKLPIPKIKFWQIASIAVKIFSKATDSNVLLNSEYDEHGNLLALDLVSERVNYSKIYRK